MSSQFLSKDHLILLLILCLSLLPWFFIPAIPQDPAYHQFIDGRGLLQIPNYMNVLSNLPFLVVGLWGLLKINQMKIAESNQLAYVIFFLGICLVGVGSGYYHWAPDNLSLIWDRLPMTLGFMALMSFIISEQVNERLGKSLLWPLLIIGFLSVIYWYWTESSGQGDLRLYGLVQFLPIILIPIFLFAYSSKFNSVKGYVYLIGFYVLAKLLEHFDVAIFEQFKIVSGHSLKHISAAIGVGFLVPFFITRDVQK